MRLDAASFLLICIYIITAVHTQDDVVVKTKYGSILGTRRHVNWGLDGITEYVDEFLGIPFAAPPIGSRRWQNPVEPPKWSGVRNGTRLSPACPQPDFHRTCEDNQDEDCLYLNIYTPYQASDPSAVYPVMVFIHGGSYIGGCGNRFNGSALAQYGVVVVPINYRLFNLGFLSSGDDVMPGNYGLLDQVQALKWIKYNIYNFRGDPDSVTIFGNSAGASSVGYLLLSAKTTGLFHGVISHSGTPNAQWTVNKRPASQLRGNVSTLGNYVGCNQSDLREQVECMRGVHWKKFNFDDVCDSIIDCEICEAVYIPVVDGSLIEAPVEDVIKQQRYQKVPYIIGLCQKEYEMLGKDLTNEVRGYIEREYNSDDILKTVRYKYTDWTNATAAPYLDYDQSWDNETFDASEMFGDRDMVAPSMMMANLMTSHGSSAVYLYVFDNDTVYHSADLNYVFGVPFVKQDMDETKFCCHFRPEDEDLSRFMMRLWATFARTSKPTLDMSILNKSDVTWNETKPETLDYLYISTDVIEMRQRFKAEKVALWTVLLPNLLINTAKKCSYVNYRTWILLALCLFLLIVICILLWKLIRKKRASKLFAMKTTKNSKL